MSESATPEFYYSQSGAEVIGPVTADALLELRSSGEISAVTLVTAAGMQSWLPLSELLDSELFKKSMQQGDASPDAAPPIRNPTLALGTLAVLFSNPVTIGLAAIGIPAYYLSRSKKRPPESILSALKPQDMREKQFLQDELLPEPGTTGPKAAMSFANKLAWAFGEFCTERAERDRVRRLKEIRQQEALKRMLQLPPQSAAGWIFYLSLIFAALFAVFYWQSLQQSNPIDYPIAQETPSDLTEHQPTVEKTENKPTHSQQTITKKNNTPVLQDVRATPSVLTRSTQQRVLPCEARLLQRYSIPLQYGILGVRAGSTIKLIEKVEGGYKAVFANEHFTVKDGDYEFSDK